MKKKSINKLSLNKEQIANFEVKSLRGGYNTAGTWTFDEWCEFEVGVSDEENPSPINMCFGEWW